MEKTNIFIILIIILSLAFVVFIYFYGVIFYEDADSNKNKNDGEIIESNELNTDSDGEELSDDLKSDNSISGKVTSASSSQGVNLPDNFYTSPCGIYFNEYGICGGVCIIGECISEGRSCYCKIA